MGNKKYEMLQHDTKVVNGFKLYRIRALKTFGNVEEGALGGYVEIPSTLSQEGNCWIGDQAAAYGGAYVTDNARITGCAQVYGDTCLKDDAVVHEAMLVGRFLGQNSSRFGNENGNSAFNRNAYNIQATAVGQYVRNGNTVFVVQFEAAKKPQVVTVASVACRDALLTAFVLLRPGARIAFQESESGSLGLIPASSIDDGGWVVKL